MAVDLSDQDGPLLRTLRERGVRITAQRRALVSLIENAGVPLRVDTLLARGRESIDGLDKTTVYRTIGLLREHGLVDELDLLHHEARGHYYEPVPDRQELHMVCLGCGRMIEESCDSWDALKEEVMSRFGFQVMTARIEIGGYCKSCGRSDGN